jgi:NADH-quinone oxidoreductase subunit C
MTVSLSAWEVSGQLDERLPEAVIETDDDSILVDGERLPDVAAFLRETPGLDFDYLSMVSGVDYYQYFEVGYQLVSLAHNHRLVIKARCHTRDNPSLPSVTGVWRSANHQEREIYDLLGISFEGHPNLRRIALWDGFQGHPLRKDFLH